MTQETLILTETEMKTNFITKELTGNEPVRCVDGRPAPDSTQGPQMLGGTLHPILLEAIISHKDFTKESVTKGIKTLKNGGYHPGIHRGEHANENDSDCGFADKMPIILKTAIEKEELITQRLLALMDANQEQFPIPIEFAEGFIEKAFKMLKNYSPDKIKITGEELIKTSEKAGAISQAVNGDHQEKVAFINLVEGATLDTITLNENENQAFNIDYHPVRAQSMYLGVPEIDSLLLTGILYQATEIVLVEDKGKKPLPVEIHA